MAAEYNITIDKGSDYVLQLAVPDANLVGATARGSIKKTAQGEKLADFVIAVNPPSGLTISLPSNVSDEIPTTGKAWNYYTTYYYDIEIVFADGRVKRLLNGEVKISPNITTEV